LEFRVDARLKSLGKAIRVPQRLIQTINRFLVQLFGV